MWKYVSRILELKTLFTHFLEHPIIEISRNYKIRQQIINTQPSQLVPTFIVLSFSLILITIELSTLLRLSNLFLNHE